MVGKGGVGKTTTSSALALWWADRGRRVHLLSTDPAHSLGDVFAQPLDAGAPTASRCAPTLLLEELDAVGRARSWLEDVREPLSELVELGTYLEAADVVDLVGESIPGADELMALLRLVELSASERAERIVVDTAPAGHTLRLLAADDILAGWADAMAAMADKAAAVGMGLTGRRPRLAGETLIGRMREEVAVFRERVLSEADFVVVTREGSVVAAETSRLARALLDRGCRIGAVVAIGGADDDGVVPTFAVPLRTHLVGCDALRSWAGPPDASSATHPSAPEEAPPDPSMMELLKGRDLYLFVGKGGVGKSTCAAAFAIALGGEQDVLLLGTDPAWSLGDVLDLPIGGAETPCAPGVVARELDAEQELTSFRARYRTHVRDALTHLGLQEGVDLDRRTLESLIALTPAGVDEIFALEAILDDVGGDRTLVVDAAPTGHLLRLLEMPEIARSWARGIMRILLEYRSLLGLDDFAAGLLAFVKRLERLVALLADPARCAALVVTLDEALPRLETERLIASLRRGGTPVAAVIQNRYAGHALDGFDVPLRVLAPRMQDPPVGIDRLRRFVERWSPA